MHELAVRKLEVRSIIKVSPHLFRLTLGGPELSGFATLAADDHVRVLFPAQGQSTPQLPPVVNGQVQWPRDRSGFVIRDYTPVRFDPLSQELDLELVWHPRGHVSTWLSSAKPGDILGVAGPRGSHRLTRQPQGLWLIGDETALPAIARFLRELPADTQVQAFIEVNDAQEKQPLPTATQAIVHWVYREGSAPGSTRLLLTTLQNAALPELPEYAWIAGEAGAVQAVRKYLCEVRGLPRDQISARGYWKLGAEDHQEPHDD